MYRKATLNDCEKVYKLICDIKCKQLPFENFSQIFKIIDREGYNKKCNREITSKLVKNRNDI